VELGYARVSTAKQDLDRQVDALHQAGIAPKRIYLDRKSGATTDRTGLKAALAYARNGDVIVVHTLDRLGRTVHDTLNLIHKLAERGVGVRNLADPIKVDSTNPADPLAQLAVVLLALFGQMERTYTLEQAAHASAVATAKGLRIGRPVMVDPDKFAHAAHLRDTGHTITEIITKTGIARTSLYRHLVDGDDFYIDLLFFNWAQNRFVVIKLKIGRFHSASSDSTSPGSMTTCATSTATPPPSASCSAPAATTTSSCTASPTPPRASSSTAGECARRVVCRGFTPGGEKCRATQGLHLLGAGLVGI